MLLLKKKKRESLRNRLVLLYMWNCVTQMQQVSNIISCILQSYSDMLEKNQCGGWISLGINMEKGGKKKFGPERMLWKALVLDVCSFLCL